MPLTGERRAYHKMGQHLRATGRPVVCQYGANNVDQRGPALGGSLWRSSGDSGAAWAWLAQIGFGPNGLEKYARPGHGNDPGMLEAGNPWLSLEEPRTRFIL
jgi:alpha-galactosidase